MRTAREERDGHRAATNQLIENDHEDKYFCPDNVTSAFFLRLLEDADRCAELEEDRTLLLDIKDAAEWLYQVLEDEGRLSPAMEKLKETFDKFSRSPRNVE